MAEGGRDPGPDDDDDVAAAVCEHCGRSFKPDKLLKHQEACTVWHPFPAVVGKEVGAWKEVETGRRPGRQLHGRAL